MVAGRTITQEVVRVGRVDQVVAQETFILYLLSQEGLVTKAGFLQVRVVLVGLVGFLHRVITQLDRVVVVIPGLVVMVHLLELAPGVVLAPIHLLPDQRLGMLVVGVRVGMGMEFLLQHMEVGREVAVQVERQELLTEVVGVEEQEVRPEL